MMIKFLIILLFLSTKLVSFAQVSFDNYANIHTIGITLDTYYTDSEGDLNIAFEYKTNLENSWSQGFEMVNSNTINVNVFNSSIFHCTPQTEYIIKITLSDPTTPTLNGVFLDTISTQSVSYNTTYSNTYYVSPSGNSSLFTLSAPGNFQAALNIVQPGERILLLEGTYFIGDLDFSFDGTSTSPITIEGESTSNVIIDGSDDISVWNTDPSVLGYKTIVSNPKCNVVIVDDVRLYPHKALKELKYHKIPWESNCRDAGLDGFFRSGNSNTLRVKFRDNSDPNTRNIKVGKHNHFIELNNTKNVNFKKLTFKYFGSNDEGAIVLKNSNNINIDSCKFEFNDIGIKLESNSNNIRVNNSEFFDGYGNWNFWRMKATYEGAYLPSCSGNNIVSDNASGSNVVNLYNNRGLEKGGIFVSGNYSGRGLIIQNSSFHDMVQGLSIRPQSWWSDNNGKTAEVDFYNNEVYNCSEDGLESDVFPRNVKIWNNTFHDVNAAISIASGADGPAYIFRNIFYNFTSDTTWISSFGNFTNGRSIKINSGNSGTSLDNTGQIYFLHNTVYAKNEHYAMDLLKPSNQTWSRMTFFNNIFSTENQYSWRLRATNFGEIQSNYNNFINNQSNLISYDNNSFSSLESYHTQYNLDENSINLNPMFTNAENTDFSLMNASPNIDAGTIIPGLNINYSGLAPDIGAIESSSTLNTLEVECCSDIEVFPNPFSTFVRVKINQPNSISKTSVKIYSATNKLVYEQKLSNAQTIINTSLFTPGIYIITVYSENDTYTEKIVKQ